MLKKYNIALTPINKGPAVISLAQKFFQHADHYQLGPQAMPHVTLQQFFAKENELEKIWAAFCAHLPQARIELEFNQFSSRTFNNEIYWISLLPNQIETLNEMHHVVLGVLDEEDQRPFEPHMTLINTRERDTDALIKKYSVGYQVIKDEFRLSLGSCDEVGQYTEMLFPSR